MRVGKGVHGRPTPRCWPRRWSRRCLIRFAAFGGHGVYGVYISCFISEYLISLSRLGQVGGETGERAKETDKGTTQLEPLSAPAHSHSANCPPQRTHARTHTPANILLDEPSPWGLEDAVCQPHALIHLENLPL